MAAKVKSESEVEFDYGKIEAIEKFSFSSFHGLKI